MADPEGPLPAAKRRRLKVRDGETPPAGGVGPPHPGKIFEKLMQMVHSEHIFSELVLICSPKLCEILASKL